jgi:glycosyltransferase involved in cell wall biosynthesis
MKPGVAPLAVVILTFNEEKNLEACLRSVTGWVEQIVVVDSGSTDRTVSIARALGAEVAVHPFETHARQWRWALESLPIRAPWVLGLDADQRVTPELQASIVRVLGQASPNGPDAFFVNRRQMFRGRWIRHGGYYPKPLLKIFRRGAATIDEHDLVDHHFRVPGTPGALAGDLIEDNRNEARIADWIAKHNRYARLQAEQELRRQPSGSIRARAFGHADERVQWRKALWYRLPLFVRPCAYFFYRYVLRLGFLDGREGFVFHVMQALWYRLLVDINIAEMRGRAGEGEVAREGQPREQSPPAPDSGEATAPAARLGETR